MIFGGKAQLWAPHGCDLCEIAGLRTDGPAIKQADKLKLGDWLRSIGILH